MTQGADATGATPSRPELEVTTSANPFAETLGRLLDNTEWRSGRKKDFSVSDSLPVRTKGKGASHQEIRGA